MPEKILIVEDDASIRKGLQLNLQLEGYHVLSADSGTEGLRMCLEEGPDLVLLDLMLPHLSGIDIIRELRQRNEFLPLVVDGTEVETTAKEFDLLRTFVQYPGQVFTREQLMARIWGEGYMGTLRTIDNFIARLRGKIEPDPDEPVHLETVRGVGYRYNV